MVKGLLPCLIRLGHALWVTSSMWQVIFFLLVEPVDLVWVYKALILGLLIAGKPFFACQIWGSHPSTSNLELNKHSCPNYWFQADALFHWRLLIWALFPQSGHYGKSCTLVTSKDNRRTVILTTNPFCRLQTSLIITALPLPETLNQERASRIQNSLGTLSCISLWHSLIVLNSQQLS